MLTSKLSERNNLLTIDSGEMKYLNQAKDQLLGLLMELSEVNNLNEDEINEIKHLIEEAYVRKKASLYLESKFDSLVSYISEAYKIALNAKNTNQGSDYTEITYFNHTKKLLANEYY